MLFGVLTLLATAVAAPGTLTHQGRLVDALGNPVEGSVELTVALYASAAATTPVWSETETVTTAQGYFSTTLGDTNPLGTLDFAGTSYWVGTTITGQGEMSPRTPLASVPSAMSLAGGFRPTPVTTAERDALEAAPGTLVYNTDLDQVQVASTTGWSALGTGGTPPADEERLIVWGLNATGGLGLGNSTAHPVPVVSSSSPTGIAMVSSGGYENGADGATCLVTEAGELYCTGYSAHVPDNNGDHDYVFEAYAPEITWANVAVGAGLVTCGVATNGAGYCWGHNQYNGTGDNNSRASGYYYYPFQVLGDVTQWKTLEPYGRHSGSHLAGVCGVSTAVGEPNGYCWGVDSYGLIGSASTGNNYTDTPGEPLAGIEWKTIEGGYLHNCGIDIHDDLYCWGYNGNGQVGDGTTTNREVPTLVSGGHKWAQVDIGNDHSCGLRLDGAVMCWGINNYGQLGDGTTTAHRVPAEVAGGGRYAQVTVGQLHSCALTHDGIGYCWGYDGTYELGNDTALVSQYVPTRVFGDYRFRIIDAGVRETVAVPR